MAGPVLLDNTVLSNFGLVNRPELVLRLWPDVVCSTPAALGAYQAGAMAGLVLPQAWETLPVAALTPEEDAFARDLPPRLGAGERTCLAAAIHRHGCLASDDHDARRMALNHRVLVTGTLGILVLTVSRGLLDSEDANQLLETMITLGYRSPTPSLDSLLQIGEG